MAEVAPQVALLTNRNGWNMSEYYTSTSSNSITVVNRHKGLQDRRFWIDFMQFTNEGCFFLGCRRVYLFSFDWSDSFLVFFLPLRLRKICVND